MSMCSICLLPRGVREKIDAALYAGIGYRKISARYSTKTRKFSHVAVCRHRKHLIPQDVRRQPPPPDPKVADTLLERIEGMISEFRAIANATRENQPPWAISAMKEIMRGLEMIGKMTGEIPAGGVGVNVNFLSGNLAEEQLASFFDAVKKRGPETIALFTRLAEERFSLTSFDVGPEELDGEIFDLLRSMCEGDSVLCERVKNMVEQIQLGHFCAEATPPFLGTRKLPALTNEADDAAIGIGAVSPNGHEL